MTGGSASRKKAGRRPHLRRGTILLSALLVMIMVAAAVQTAPGAHSQQVTSTTTTTSSSSNSTPDSTKTEVSILLRGSSSVVLQALVTDLNPKPTNPKGFVSWSDGGAGGNFTESGTCTLLPDLSTYSDALCHITYTTGASSSGSIVVVFTATYLGDSAHSPSSGKLTLTLAGGGETTTTTTVGTTTVASNGGTTTTTSNELTTSTSGGITASITTIGVVGGIPEATQAAYLALAILLAGGSYLLYTRVSLTRIVLRRTTARVGLALIGFLILLTVYGQFLDPYPVRAFPCLFTCPGLPPFVSLAHPFGTYATGQDVFSEVAHGTPIDLTIGLLATAVAVLVGTTVGLLAGYGKWVVQDMMMAFIEIVLLLPSFAIVVWIYRSFGNTNIFLSPLQTNYLALLLGLFAWPPIALVVRDAAKTLQQSEFVSAAKALGAGTRTVVVRHVLPNIVTSILSIASVVFAANITAESLFAYLGLVQPQSDVVTWGFLLWEGLRHLYGQWWISFFPGVMIVSAVLGFSLLGDAISEALNPKAGVRI